jgi:hypothetical protein
MQQQNESLMNQINTGQAAQLISIDNNGPVAKISQIYSAHNNTKTPPRPQ